MSILRTGDAARGEDLDALLLSTKLNVPMPRAGLVSRRELIERVRTARVRAVAVSAPAGYGKSSLLAEWAAIEKRPVAWVSLDRYDDDPGTLLALIISAFVGSVGGDPRLIADVQGRGTAALGRSAPLVGAVLRNSDRPFVLMIDDLHELASPDCHDVLSVIISNMPEGSLFVSASRHEQPHVAWLRADDDVVEVGMESLALDASGATQVFAASRVELSPHESREVVLRTEGWPVGMQLAAIVSRDGGNVAAITGDDLTIADYLYRTTLASLPEPIQQFLRRTAVLARMSASLCDYVLNESSSQAKLLELEASGLFLIRLDRRRQWFRYHALFQEFLLSELDRLEPGQAAHLHARAADWHENHGSPARAVEHLLEAEEVARAVQVTAQLMLPTYESGQVATVQRWLSVLGDDAIAEYPPMAVMAGWIMALTGQAREAERWAALVEHATFEGTPTDGTASFDSGRAMLRSYLCVDGPEQSRRDADFALAQEPSWSPWRDLALAVAGEARLALGDVSAAKAHFAEASEVARTGGNREIGAICDAEIGLIAMTAGDWDIAETVVNRARTTVSEHHLEDYAAAAMVFPAAARFALHQGRTKDAQRELASAMRVRTICTHVLPTLGVRLRLHTAYMYVSLADVSTARHLVREIDDIIAQRPKLGVLIDEVARFKRRLDAHSSDGLNGPPLTPAELRLLPYLQTHLTYPEIGARLFVSRNTVSTEVSAIYRKLGVSSRMDAVNRAIEVGLLGA
ncbi:LuxR C-terminal-related transcriptional regulator [Microbacterium sp. R86528]|uniref:helix-turn-helix transcriptional regulator n=1 Tax=Microbacterium sp. R86528 TaxID=3093864 RepID=UPI0037C80359